jgi:hypothetical protein
MRVSERGVELKLEFNNKGLRKMFKGTKLTKKKLELGELDATFLKSSIISVEGFEYGSNTFSIDDIELEGYYDAWVLNVKMNVK